MFRRDIAALREMQDKDLAALAATVDARLAGMDQDRMRLWERMRELPAQQEIASNHFRDEVTRRDEAGRQLIEQRLADLDKAREVSAAQMSKFLDEARETHRRMHDTFVGETVAEREFIMAQIEIVRSVMGEKFGGVTEQFVASKIAVDAALSAAKEAVAEQNKSNSQAITKSETATKEQLASLSRVTDAGIAGLSDKIDDARTRLTTLESRTAGIRDSRAETSSGERDAITVKQAELQAEQVRLQAMAARMQMFSLVIAALVVALGIYTALHK